MKTSTIEDIVHTIDIWLSREPVFCSTSGSVAGVTRGNRTVYWYAEIAGYYLSYLTGVITTTANMTHSATRAAQRVTKWLQDQWKDGPALTRVYPGVSKDWRNDGVFVFDLAMVLQGLTAIEACNFRGWQGQPIAEFVKTMLTDERGNLRAIFSKTGGRLPSRWSTRMDGHQLKTAASLIAWGTQFNDPVLRDLGVRTVCNLDGNGTMDWPHLPPHPRLYALEGALRCGLTTADTTAVNLELMLDSTDLKTERTDVLAQLLRLALVCGFESRQVDSIIMRLLASIDTDGSVAIRPQRTGRERNTWCAIFARQALFFYLEARRGKKLHAGLCI